MKNLTGVFYTPSIMSISLIVLITLFSCSKTDTLRSGESGMSQESLMSASASSKANLSSLTFTGTKLAFPEATGFAKESRGAYAKYEQTGNTADLPKVLYVDNLNNSGTGSLRTALTATYPRIVIFRVGGTIALSSTISITSPYITIAGYTAPGGGICIKGATIWVMTSEVIIRNIRVRNGVWAAPDHGTDGISISAQGTKIKNVIIDHCSVSWASDEQIGINGTKGGIENVTVQNSILAEGFLGHAFGILCNGKLGDTYHITNVSIHRNLFVSTEGRTPRFGEYVTGTVINNLVHNWGSKASEYVDGTKGDILYNKFKPGKNTSSGGLKKTIEIIWDGSTQKSAVYVAGNGSVPPLLYGYPSGSTLANSLANSAYYNSSIYGFTPISDLSSLESNLLPTVGAFPRDAADARFVSQYINGTGSIPTSAGTYPTLKSAVYPANNSGIHTAWLVKKGYAASETAASALTQSYLINPANGKNGYSILEEFMNDAALYN
ncbi:hypothetical protein [Flavisolibacter ginsengisoli]|jgi:hypothetical protein|uniref:Pectate lyase n=1 Tax=Flavisolibacter ginsengisoli DSM 18119 TaxID=1121884 RepID=A0A1M5B9J2_9BACT|nr:hypothetical protein [Flavisolibacter ginsengisoli]SHF39076.1 pectate lyase [Flavisolibacter ginsengisoli DSM 18119]